VDAVYHHFLQKKMSLLELMVWVVAALWHKFANLHQTTPNGAGLEAAQSNQYK